MSGEIYKRLRPTDFGQMFGTATKKSLAVLEKFLQKGKLPQTILICGGSGTGKTSVARILKSRLNCSDEDYVEVDCASDASIDKMRELKRLMKYRPLGGPSRVFYLDEAQALSRTNFAQQSLLKALEDTPEGVYFLLGSTNPEKLLPAVLTRCTRVDVHPLKDSEMRELIDHVCEEERVEVEEGVRDLVSGLAGGSPRQALVLLESVLQIERTEDRLEFLQNSSEKADWFGLLKALLYSKAPKWADVAEDLKEIKSGEVEGLRKYVLNSACTELLKANANAKRAACVIARFESPFFESDRAGLVLAFYDCVTGK